MAINFPNSPTLNEEFTSGATTWKWDGVKWNLTVSGATGPAGPTGPTGAASTVTGPTGPTGPTGATGTVKIEDSLINLFDIMHV